MAPKFSDKFWQNELIQLKRGWDSYDAAPITGAAIETAGSIYTVPTHEGGIQVELHRDGFDVEIFIAPDGKVTGVSVQTVTSTHKDAAPSGQEVPKSE